MTPPVTPEPLREQELDKLLKLPGCGLGHAHGINCGVPVPADILDRLIAQARAAARPSPWQKVTRVEVIAEGGRAFTRWDCHLEHTDSMFQDDGRTLKLFVKGGTPTSPPAQGRRTPVVNELPSIEEMAGSVSDVTGGQTLEEFMRRLRGE